MMIPFLNNFKSRKKQLSLLPLTLKWHQTIILPSRYGTLFIILLTGMLAGSINYNNNLGFLLTFLMGSMALISVLYTFKNLSDIRIVSTRLHPVFAGDMAIFEFLVQVPHKNRFAICFQFEGSKAVVQDFSTDMPNQISIPILSHTRGNLRPGPLQIRTIYPFGLFTASAQLHIDIECSVYPHPIAMPLKHIDGAPSNNNKGKKKRHGVDDFQGLQTYQPGDSLQRISWKTFSRGHGLFTKMFKHPSDTEILLDWNMLNDPNIERKLSMLCHEVLKANRQNKRYGLKIPGQTLSSGKGETHKHRCLKALAMFPRETDTA